jgi:Na+/H+ antiporter NhaC
MLTNLILLFVAALIAFAFIGMLSDKQSGTNSNLTPGLKLLPGDIKWENQSGNVKVYFPITSSIVLSIIVSLVLWVFR